MKDHTARWQTRTIPFDIVIYITISDTYCYIWSDIVISDRYCYRRKKYEEKSFSEKLFFKYFVNKLCDIRAKYECMTPKTQKVNNVCNIRYQILLYQVYITILYNNSQKGMTKKEANLAKTGSKKVRTE